MEVKIEELKVSKHHQEIYTTNDIDDLLGDIPKFGLHEKIVVNKSYEIISGYRRYLALKTLGRKTVDVVIKDVAPEDERAIVLSFNKQRKKTCRELLNEAKYFKSIWGQKRGRKSANDNVIQLNPESVDTRKKIADATGIKPTNLTKLEYIDRLKPELIDHIDKGNASINQVYHSVLKSEQSKENRDIAAQLPQIISDPSYKIYNKSSHDLSDLEDESVQMVFTSPPYWGKRRYTNDDNELGAEETKEEYVEKLVNHLFACHRVLKSNGSLFLNIGDTHKNKTLHSIPHRVLFGLEDKGFMLVNTIVWKKKNNLPHTKDYGLTPSYEFIFHLVKSKDFFYKEILMPINNIKPASVQICTRKNGRDNFSDFGKVIISGLKDGKKIEDYWTRDIVTTATANQAIIKKYDGVEHPAPFPKEITILPILQTTKPGDVVLDLFAGSGTTSEAALLLGRKTIAYELNPIHNETQVKRYNKAIEQYKEVSQPSQISQAA
ncbi:MAG TPA: hypothetical protein DHV28_17295 [Ignavibacteriales bacterium]|nr:hypothetical protein [Ignavibacteriales bacterium]